LENAVYDIEVLLPQLGVKELLLKVLSVFSEEHISDVRDFISVKSQP